MCKCFCERERERECYRSFAAIWLNTMQHSTFDDDKDDDGGWFISSDFIA